VQVTVDETGTATMQPQDKPSPRKAGRPPGRKNNATLARERAIAAGMTPPPAAPPATQGTADKTPALAIGLRKDEVRHTEERIHRLTDQLRTEVARHREAHPQSQVGDVVDPFEAAKAPPKKLDVPLIPADVVGFSMGLAYDLICAKLKLKQGVDIERPKDEIFEKVGKSWAEASKYWGGQLSERGVALAAATTNTIMVFFPLGVAAAQRSIQKSSGKNDAKAN